MGGVIAGEFLHDRRLAGAADGQISNRNDLDAERLVAEDAPVVKPAANLDGDREKLGTAEQKPAHQPRLDIMALVEDDFEDEGFKGFGPGPESFTHRDSMCQICREF